MKLNVIDLFAGCGGFTEGFLQTGNFKTLAAVEWEFAPLKTLRNRLETKWGYTNTEDNILHFDIQKTHDLLNGYMDSQYGISKGLIEIVDNKSVDVIIGGPPCQAYSMAGRVRDENGMQDDYRNYLFESYVKMVDYFQPSCFVFENVQGILSAKPGGISIINRISEAFSEIGYEVAENLENIALFDTSYYGVPQKRKRVIIYGVKKGENSTQQVRNFYSLIKEKKQTYQSIAKVAFQNIPKIFPLKNSSHKRISHEVEKDSSIVLKNHVPRFHNKRDIEIFKTLTEDVQNGTGKYFTSQSLIQLYEERTGRKTNVHKYHVIREDRPSNTIPAHLYKDGLRHIHPDPKQARSITVREAARLQSFPDDFEFLSAKGDQYKMIGNAVPPTFAKLIGETVYELFQNENKNLNIQEGLFQQIA